MCLLILCLAFFAENGEGLQNEYRTWTDTSGKHHIVARMVAMEKGEDGKQIVVLERQSDGKRIEISPFELCKQDRRVASLSRMEIAPSSLNGYTGSVSVVTSKPSIRVEGRIDRINSHGIWFKDGSIVGINRIESIKIDGREYEVTDKKFRRRSDSAKHSRPEIREVVKREREEEFARHKQQKKEALVAAGLLLAGGVALAAKAAGNLEGSADGTTATESKPSPTGNSQTKSSSRKHSVTFKLNGLGKDHAAKLVGDGTLDLSSWKKFTDVSGRVNFSSVPSGTYSLWLDNSSRVWRGRIDGNETFSVAP